MRHCALIAALALGGCAAQPIARGQSFRQLFYRLDTEVLKTDGVEISYSDQGKGEPAIVLLHGLGGYIPFWQRNLDVLASKHRVIAVDLLGHGRSQKPARDLTIALQSRAVGRILEKLKARSFILVGHGLGAQIAVHYAASGSLKPKGLVLSSPEGLVKSALDEDARAALEARRWVEPSTAAEIERAISQQFSWFPSEARFWVEDRERIIGGPEFSAWARSIEQLARASVREPVHEKLRALSMPTLVLYGERDTYSTVANAKTELLDAAKALKRSTVKGLAGGHALPLERPDEWNAEVLKFAASL